MLRRLRVWARALVRRDQVEREMTDEMRLHLERATERLMARGLSRGQAEAEARREFGNVGSIEEEARDARGVRWIEETIQDARYAARGLRLRPGFTFGVVATLALGVGANAVMFGIVDRLFFRPPAFVSAPDRTHRLYFTRMIDGSEFLGQSFQYQRFVDFSRSSRSMEVLAAYSPRRLAVGRGDDAEEISVGGVSASLWRLFDARPVVGRFFTEEEDRDAGGARVAVLSYGYWQSEFGGSPDAVGSALTIGPVRYTVIGIAPRGFAAVAMTTPKLFVPLAVTAIDEFGASWNADRAEYSKNWLELYGRRRPGVSTEAANADLSAAFRESYRKQLSMDGRLPSLEIAKPRIILESMLIERGPHQSADARVATWLLGVTSIVMLIACANAGNLLLARALSRRREVGVRIALGVSRGRLSRQLLMESTLLAALGAVLGLVLAQFAGRLVQVSLLPTVEWGGVVGDRRVFLFATALALFTGLLAGLAPLVQAMRCDVTSALKSGSRDGQGSRSALRGGLTLAQVTFSVMLLVGAGLFVRSAERVSRVDLGYDTNRLLLVEAQLRGAEFSSTQKDGIRSLLMERALAHPAIESASFVCSAPFYGTCSAPVSVAGVDSTSRLGEFVRQVASPTYFETMGLRILRGRAHTAEDRVGGQLVVVVSESMARSLWPNQDAIGQCLRVRADTAPCRTVVGIAENERQVSVRDAKTFVFYLPAAQAAERDWGNPQRIRLFVRVHGDPASHAESIRSELQRALPASGYVVTRTLESTLASVTRSWRLGATMFSVFGTLALVIAAIGLYSVIAYTVGLRQHEMGIRIALGARSADVVQLIVRDGVRLVVAGVALGTAVSLIAARWLGPLLFDVSPHDPLVFAGVAVLLVSVAICASSVPAMRASRVDPTTALRSD